jgi:hypothetical protein
LSAAHHPLSVLSPPGSRRASTQADFLQLYNIPSQIPSSLDIPDIDLLFGGSLFFNTASFTFLDNPFIALYALSHWLLKSHLTEWTTILTEADSGTTNILTQGAET